MVIIKHENRMTVFEKFGISFMIEFKKTLKHKKKIIKGEQKQLILKVTIKFIKLEENQP